MGNRNADMYSIEKIRDGPVGIRHFFFSSLKESFSANRSKYFEIDRGKHFFVFHFVKDLCEARPIGKCECYSHQVSPYCNDNMTGHVDKIRDQTSCRNVILAEC
jgi:hypothetical protein